MGFPGFYNRFLTNHPLSLNNFALSQGIFYLPKTRVQLHGILALVFNMNPVTKRKMHFVVLVERALEVGDHRNFYASGYLLDHGCLLIEMELLKRTTWFIAAKVQNYFITSYYFCS